MYTLFNDTQALYVRSTATQARTTLCSILCDAAQQLLQAKVSYRGRLNGLTDYRQTAKNITDYTDKTRKNYQQATGKILTDNRHGPTLQRWFYSEINRIFDFSFLSKVCVKVIHFKSQFRYLQNFLSSTYLCQIVIKSRRFDLSYFPGMYITGLPISCQQLNLICQWATDQGKCALISRETDFSH